MRKLKAMSQVTRRICDKTKAAPKRKAKLIKQAETKKGKRFV
jgi:hypothetical protein